MTDAQQSRHESDTEVIPPVSSGEGMARTQELPAVGDPRVDEPSLAEDAGDSGPAPITERIPERVPQPIPGPQGALAARPAPAAVAPVQESQARQVASPSPTAPAAPPRSSGGSTRWRSAFWALITALVIGAVAGVVVLRARGELGIPGLGAGGSTAGAVAVSAGISSLDPSGGSGFRSEGGTTWRTQTYQSANFGNLKSGVGLLLDLGAPRAVSAVTFEVAGGPIAVDLRAGDQRAGSESGYARITGVGGASGLTTFTVKGAKHRYWLIWVTRLAAQDGGYRAVIRQPVVKASAN